MKSIVLFASGSGSNAENIIRHFKQAKIARVTAVFCNNPNAGVVPRANILQTPVVLFSREEIQNPGVLRRLEAFKPDLIVLCGFLLKLPETIVEAYPNKIINIHPALLPKYGGKGMYGMQVHRAIYDNKEVETGVSIHYVNKNYDEGALIAQYKIHLQGDETPELIASKVQQLEHQHFPVVIEQLLKDNLNPEL